MQYKRLAASFAMAAGLTAAAVSAVADDNIITAGLDGHSSADLSAHLRNASNEAESAEETSGIQIHRTMRDDPGIYARDLYLAYIKSPDENINRMTEMGLMRLAAEAAVRTSVEPAGVVGLDIESDDLSLFPVIYWPVNDDYPRLSAQARTKVQEHAGNGGLFAIDLYGSASLTSSEALYNLLDDMQTRPLKVVREGDVLTQSFYIIDELSGAASRDVLVEQTPEELQASDVTAFIIGEQNWAGAWSGMTVGSDVAENSIRAGLNMLYVALMGTYKLDEMHQEVIEQKREFREQHKQRESSGEAGTTPYVKPPEPEPEEEPERRKIPKGQMYP